MKIIHKNIKDGVIKLRVNSLDDLWYISQVIQMGDSVKGVTQRRVKAKDDILRGGGGERKTISLSVKVEKIDFRTDSSVLRVSGVVVGGPDDVVSLGSHHTINIEDDSVITIKKREWQPSDLDRLKEAVEATLKPKVIISVVDEGEACVGVVGGPGIKYYEISAGVGGKYETKGRADRKKGFYKKLSDFITGLLEKEGASSIVVAGAGFEKENFYKYLVGEHSDLSSKTVVENIGSHGRTGVNEVLKRPILTSVLSEINAAQDMKLVEEFLEHLGKESGLAAYGFNETQAAVSAGACEKLLISDKYFLANRKALEDVLKNVKHTRGIFHIINSANDAGKQLDGLGGIAAVLRYKIN